MLPKCAKSLAAVAVFLFCGLYALWAEDACVGAQAGMVNNLKCYVYVYQDKWGAGARVRLLNDSPNLVQHFYKGLPAFGFRLSYLDGAQDPRNRQKYYFEFGGGKWPEGDNLLPGSSPSVGVTLFTPTTEIAYREESAKIDPATAGDPLFGFVLSQPGEYRLTVLSRQGGIEKEFAALEFHYESEQISQPKK